MWYDFALNWQFAIGFVFGFIITNIGFIYVLIRRHMNGSIKYKGIDYE